MEEDERDPSVASGSDFYSEPNTPATTHQRASTPAKRKAEDSDAGPEKKRKLEPMSSSLNPSSSPLLPCIGLPPEIWQNVFLSCSPATLGRLLQGILPPSHGTRPLNVVTSESIWMAARKDHATRPPRPPEGVSEVDLWPFIMGKECHFCKKSPESAPGEKPWEKGPGQNGVRIIWPFWVRACGPCLQERCEKENTLLLSAASALRPALPFAFITSDSTVIAASSLSDPALPPNLQISKVYYKPQIRKLEEELVEAQSRGSAAAEEWLKGLESRGRSRMNNASVWERWEVKKHHQDTRRTPIPMSASPSPNYSSKTVSPMRPNAPSSTTNGVPVPTLGSFARPRPDRELATTQALPPRPVVAAQPAHVPYHVSQPPLYHPRPERNIHDANEAKAARRADIERRCQALSPPIPANVLRHMESFKAAIQISQPLTEYSWEVLKPRLLAQKAEAERAESEQSARMASLQTRVADRRLQDASLKEVKEVLDREWEESQRPVRDRLAAYADEFIASKWSGEKSINYDSSPRFAAELLIDVRRRFYSDTSKDAIASNGANNQDLDQQAQATPRTLILENMKWVYDNKIKPLTEQYRKELFICHGCEGNFRYYGFEGVIQHYGAKHTSAFSNGNIVVSWREAEWPEDPPFHPDPSAARNAAHSMPTSLPAHGHSAYAPYYGGYSRGGTITPQMPLHLASPSPYIPYATQFNGPFPPPPPANPGHGINYNYAQGYTQPQPMDPYNGYQQGYLGYSTSPMMGGSFQPPVSAPHPANGYGFQTSPLQVPATAASVKQESDKVDNITPDEQVRSLVDMARNIWSSTSGIKDLPNSVRVYVLLDRVVCKFQLQFDHEPTLDHFIKAVSNHIPLLNIKAVSGLSCKTCHLSRPEDRTTHNFVSLLSHFKSDHLGKFGPRPNFQTGQQLHILDWKEDMIDLPSDRAISGLIHAPGMDHDKLHIIARVFPALFPPGVGVVDQSGAASASLSDSKSTKKGRETPGALTDDLGPSSHRSPFGRPYRPASGLGEEEYDPSRPALVRDARYAIGPSHRMPSHSWSPPPEDRRLYYAEPRIIRPREPSYDEYAGHPPRGYVEARHVRESGPLYEEIRERRPVYVEREVWNSRGVAYPGRDPHYGGGFFSRDPRLQSRSPSPPKAESDADRFLNEFVPPPPLPQYLPKQEDARQAKAADGDPDDGTRYSPPPVLGVPLGEAHMGLSAHPSRQPTSNGSRYEDPYLSGQQPRTPDSGNPPRRAGTNRRRDKPEYVPSRYARYSAVREEPYARGHSIQRTNSRYETKNKRYEEQRRRLDQEGGSTPQPPDHDLDTPRHSSIDPAAYADEHRDPYLAQLRHGSREYVVEDPHIRGAPPARYVSRFAADPHDALGALPPQQPQYVDEYGEPVYVRVHREEYAPRYDDRERIEYVPVPYERVAPRERGAREEYVYVDERAPLRERKEVDVGKPPGPGVIGDRR